MSEQDAGPRTPAQGDGVPGDGPRAGTARAVPWLVGIGIGILIGAFAVWLLTRGDDTQDVAGTDGAAGSSSTAAGSSSSSTTTTDGDDGSGATGTTASTLSDEGDVGGGISAPEGAATTPVSVPAPEMQQTGLVAVRTARHEGYDRVVFEFDGELPGYEVMYAEPPIRESGSGNEVSVQGDAVVTVRMTPASGVRFTDDGYEEVYSGPDRVPGAGATVTEVVEVGDFEGQTTWAVGLADRVDFAVTALQSPARLVVDFVNH